MLCQRRWLLLLHSFRNSSAGSAGSLTTGSTRSMWTLAPKGESQAAVGNYSIPRYCTNLQPLQVRSHLRTSQWQSPYHHIQGWQQYQKLLQPQRRSGFLCKNSFVTRSLRHSHCHNSKNGARLTEIRGRASRVRALHEASDSGSVTEVDDKSTFEVVAPFKPRGDQPQAIAVSNWEYNPL